MRLLLLSLLFLTACTTAPVSQKMPEMPQDLAEKCRPLLLLEGQTTTLSKLMETVATNYTLRHECATQVDMLQKWYAKEKKAFDEANK